jgi:hypothetical protein
MTRREQMEAVFFERTVERPPVCIRLDLWYTDARARGTLPSGSEDLTCQDIEDQLGFCRAARHRSGMDLSFRGGETVTRQEGEHSIVEYRFPEKTLIRDTHTPEEQRLQGIQGQIVRYPLQEKRDYEILTDHLDEAEVQCDLAGFEEMDRETGDSGLPLFIAHSSPAHNIMLRFTGYENFYYHQADFPEVVDALVRRLEGFYRSRVWPLVAESTAKIVMHGNHFSSQMTPPPVFEKYFVPYYQDFSRLMHENGKKLLWHADAEMGSLLNHVLNAGFDGADCLATSPLTPQTIEDYFETWEGRIVCWGGLPSVIFVPSYPLDEYRRYIDHVSEVTAGRKDFIFGASDNVMPGAEWERLTYLAERTVG